MKKILSLLSLAALTIGLLGSCSKINERIDSLDKRVYDLEHSKIASVEQQITAINVSINDLKTADATINGKIADLKTTAETLQTLIDALKEADKALVQKDEALEARIATLEGQVGVINGQIKTLEEADKAINARIDELKTYIDTEIGKTKDWASASFATLEEYRQTAADLATLSVTVSGISNTLAAVQTSITTLDTKIDGIDAALQGKIADAKTELEGQIADLKTELEGKITDAIKTSEATLKGWVNEQLSGYYTIAEIDVIIAGLQSDIDDLETKIETNQTDIQTNKTKIAELETKLNNLSAELTQAKATIKTEYEAAIAAAITEYNGTITQTIQSKIAEVNATITALTARVETLEAAVSTLQADVAALKAMIQSVTIIPAYNDGSVEEVGGILYLDIIVEPADAVKGLTKDNLKVLVNEVKTKAASYTTLNAASATVDETTGNVTITADISGITPAEGKALTVALNVRNGISDFTTEFVVVTTVVKAPTFKAVYDTNGGANTLTFYYDAVDHSGEGKTVYEGSTGNHYLFDDTKSNNKKWGYSSPGICTAVKSVTIDSSVADYTGLTSTAFMFQGMKNATGISGAEYLDVANVTDMSYMFNNFGGGNTNSHTTLNSVPNVSGWNTGNVTNMTAMFESYGNFSDNLAIVPDVSNWNTGNVTDMTYMFQKYGHESQTFNAVPDVSKWNTGNVTNMANMFMEYGHKSTSLNTVPNVSGWNTGKVTNMKQMFYNYGSTSENISCVLDLSGWDLSTITENNGVNVFNFNPKTFDVTIPAKTGEKSNEGGKWYYGNGTGSIAPPSGKTFTLPLPAGALAGEFSVSATKKVLFSQGNLWADGSNALHFESNQYSSASSWDASHVSHFTWSSTVEAAVGDFFSGDNLFCDESHKVSVDGGDAIYYALSKDEWTYLFDNHTYGWASVNGKTGYVIAPDGFTGNLESSYADDAALASAGNLVFLPAAGSRDDGSSVNNVGDFGIYWSSTALDSDGAYRVFFDSSDVFPGYDGYRDGGYSVRLITESK